MEKNWSSEIIKKLKNTPNKPGCYIMRDTDGVIIYIGKAKSLRKRLQSYFRPHSFRNANHKNKGFFTKIKRHLPKINKTCCHRHKRIPES